MDENPEVVIRLDIDGEIIQVRLPLAQARRLWYELGVELGEAADDESG